MAASAYQAVTASVARGGQYSGVNAAAAATLWHHVWRSLYGENVALACIIVAARRKPQQRISGVAAYLYRYRVIISAYQWLAA